METYVAPHFPGWATILALVASYAAGRLDGHLRAMKSMRSITRSDEGRTGHIASIWWDADNRRVCTVMLEPTTLCPKVLVLGPAQMPGEGWSEGQPVVIRDGFVNTRVTPKDTS